MEPSGDINVGKGNSVVVCQLLGPLHTDAAQLDAAKGYDPAMAKQAVPAVKEEEKSAAMDVV